MQVLWGVFFSLTGFGKILWYKPALWNQALQEVPWLSAVPQDLAIFIGVAEFLGGVGLILPAMTGVKPKLTPLAAIGLTLVMILAAVFHIVRGEYNFVPINLVLGRGRRVHRVWTVGCEAHRTRVDQQLPRTERAGSSRRAGSGRFCSGLVQVDTHSLIEAKPRKS